MIDWETFKSQLQTNPGKLLKSVLLLAGCFLVIWILVIVQSDTSMQNNVQIQESGRLDSLQIATNRANGVSSHEVNQPTSQNTGASDGFSIFPIILFFTVALGGVWFWVHSKNKSLGKTESGTVFTTVGSQQLPGGQQLVVIKLNNEYWVMTTGGTQGMNLLHRYPADEWQGLAPQPEKTDWKNTFLETLNASAFQKKKTV